MMTPKICEANTGIYLREAEDARELERTVENLINYLHSSDNTVSFLNLLSMLLSNPNLRSMWERDSTTVLWAIDMFLPDDSIEGGAKEGTVTTDSLTSLEERILRYAQSPANDRVRIPDYVLERAWEKTCAQKRYRSPPRPVSVCGNSRYEWHNFTMLCRYKTCVSYPMLGQD